jgi:hypothetical protein
VSRQVHSVEVTREGVTHLAGYAPYLDYRPLKDDERPPLATVLEDSWLRQNQEDRVQQHAITQLVPKHLEEVRARRGDLVEKTRAAIRLAGAPRAGRAATRR